MRPLIPVARVTVAVACVAVALATSADALASAPPGRIRSAPAARSVRQGGPAPGSLNATLNAVAVASPTSAWAVGRYLRVQTGKFQTLIEHWDGAAWTVTPSPDPGGPDANNYLYGVAALSPTLAWAVGAYRKGDKWHPLVERWDGAAWKQVSCPNPEHPSVHKYFPATALYAITAVSASDIWAVGAYNDGHTQQTLIMHWAGRSWKQVPSPDIGGPGTFNILRGVAVASRPSAWAVGAYGLPHSPGGHTLILHWNGTSWRRVPAPTRVAPVLSGVAAWGSHAWAVGYYGGLGYPLAEYWNGSSWRQTARAPQNWVLTAVAATAPTTAWAVGYVAYKGSLIERWNGTSWKRVPSPGGGDLAGVSVLSATDAWAVGSQGLRTLTMQWNGTSWVVVPSP